jgi:hypothetical protein
LGVEFFKKLVLKPILKLISLIFNACQKKEVNKLVKRRVQLKNKLKLYQIEENLGAFKWKKEHLKEEKIH